MTWHKHDEEDELFYVIKGRLTIEYEDGSVTQYFQQYDSENDVWNDWFTGTYKKKGD